MQCRLEVIPLTVQLPGLLVFAPPTALVGTARRSRRSLANVLLLTITLLCMPFIFAQHCSPFIERALLVAEASPRCQCRTLPVIHTHTLAHTPTPYLKMSPLPQM